MFVKRSSLVLASLMALPSAAFALGFGDLRLLSPLNAPLDAEIELVDVAPEDMQSLKALRKFDEKYGDARREKKRSQMGFEVVPRVTKSEDAMIRK